MTMPQTIMAVYEDGVLMPLEKVKLKKHTKVRVKITPLAKSKDASRRRTLKPPGRAELVKRARESFGMWADRGDIKDAVEWENEMRAGWEGRLKDTR